MNHGGKVILEFVGLRAKLYSYKIYEDPSADFPSRYQIWPKMLIDAEIMAQNRNPRWRAETVAVCHLGFVTSSYRITHEVFSLGNMGLSNYFCANPMHSFEDRPMTIWFFCRFGLKCLFTPPFFLGGSWIPKRDWSSSRDPQKAHPLPKPHLHADFGADRSTGATWARSEGIKNKKKAKETYSGKLGFRTDHPRWRSDMWSCIPGGLREVVI